MGEPLAKLQLLSSLGLPKEAKSGKSDLVWVCVIQFLEEIDLNNWTFIEFNRLLWEKAKNNLKLADKITLVL